MKKIKVSEASNTQLSWLVGIAEGYEMSLYGVDPSIRAWEKGLGVRAPWMPTCYWNQMGPIIERERIELTCPDDEWRASNFYTCVPHYEDGPTPLVAAARCFVTSKLGETVEVPEELLS